MKTGVRRHPIADYICTYMGAHTISTSPSQGPAIGDSDSQSPPSVRALGDRFEALQARLFRWLERRDWDEGATLMVFGAVVGIITGLGVVGFYRLIDLSHLLFIRWPDAHLPWIAHAIYQPLLTALGIWSAWLLARRTRTPEGQNVPDVQLAVAKRDGMIATPPVLVRTLSSAFTLGSGGSAGSEGPVAVIGAAVGSALGRRLRFQPRHLKILLGCGAAAGIAGAFNAPFAGAFFALEEVLGSFSVSAFSPVVIASVVGALTVRPFLGSHPVFDLPSVPDAHPIASALLFPLLGIACGWMSALYARFYLRAPQLFARMPGPEWLRPVVGGLLTGAIVLASGGMLAGNGHLAIPSPIFGGLAWWILLAIALAKTVATGITLGSGGSGGVFTPTLFIGAALGGSLGVLANQLLPAHIVNPQAWALVGMAGLIAGATRAPLTAIFMVFEMTDSYGYVVPLMIVAVIAYVTAKRLSPHGLYDGWLAARGEHLAHGVDRSIMDHLHVRDVIDRHAITIDSAARLRDLIATSAGTRQTVFPVVEPVPDSATSLRLVGVITQHTLREAILERGALADVLVAEDLAEATETLGLHQSLREALSTMNARGIDALPVTDMRNGRVAFVGVITRADIMLEYERVLARTV
jgi:CIC family chloride channel protein